MRWETIRRSMALLLLIAQGSTNGQAQELSPTERKGMQQSGQWQTGGGIVSRGEEGKVIFLFGQAQPSVICAPLQVCDIELQAQETVHDILLGDSVRWSVEAASSGEGQQQRIHLIVRPAESGLETSMVVTTSRRSYHFRLRSHESRYMARIGFSYPDSITGDMAAVNARLQAGTETQPMAGLDFAYRISGQARWRPKRVYSDGQKTYIQFPPGVSGQDMPVLFLLSQGQKQIVNYRVNKTTMTVDYHIDEAILVSGTGWRQKKITIRRGG